MRQRNGVLLAFVLSKKPNNYKNKNKNNKYKHELASKFETLISHFKSPRFLSADIHFPSQTIAGNQTSQTANKVIATHNLERLKIANDRTAKFWHKLRSKVLASHGHPLLEESQGKFT